MNSNTMARLMLASALFVGAGQSLRAQGYDSAVLPQAAIEYPGLSSPREPVSLARYDSSWRHKCDGGRKFDHRGGCEGGAGVSGNRHWRWAPDPESDSGGVDVM